MKVFNLSSIVRCSFHNTAAEYFNEFQCEFEGWRFPCEFKGWMKSPPLKTLRVTCQFISLFSPQNNLVKSDGKQFILYSKMIFDLFKFNYVLEF